MEWQAMSCGDSVDASEDDDGTVVVRSTTPKPRTKHYVEAKNEALRRSQDLLPSYDTAQYSVLGWFVTLVFVRAAQYRLFVQNKEPPTK